MKMGQTDWPEEVPLTEKTPIEVLGYVEPRKQLLTVTPEFTILPEGYSIGKTLDAARAKLSQDKFFISLEKKHANHMIVAKYWEEKQQWYIHDYCIK